MGGGAIAGIVIAPLVVVLIASVATWYWYSKYNKNVATDVVEKRGSLKDIYGGTSSGLEVGDNQINNEKFSTSNPLAKSDPVAASTTANDVSTADPVATVITIPVVTVATRV